MHSYPMPAEPPLSIDPFTHLKARHVLLSGVGISLGLGVILGIFAHHLPLSIHDPAMRSMLYILIVGLMTLWVLWRFQYLGIRLQSVVGHMPPAYRWLPTLGLVIALITFSAGAFLLSFYGLSLFVPTVVETVLVNLQVSSSQTHVPELHRLLTVLALVIVAPVTEELIFRGVLLQRWAQKWGVRPALMASSLLFGMFHPNVVGLSVFGLIMGVLYINTRTLLVPIACHALNNALVLLFSIATSESTSQVAPSLTTLHASLGSGIILVTLSAPWLVWFLRRNFPRSDAPMPYRVNARLTDA